MGAFFFLGGAFSTGGSESATAAAFAFAFVLAAAGALALPLPLPFPFGDTQYRKRLVEVGRTAGRNESSLTF